MKQDHMIGITPAYDGPNYEKIRQLGVKWVREGFAFPFSEEGAGKVSKAFLRSEDRICGGCWLDGLPYVPPRRPSICRW